MKSQARDGGKTTTIKLTFSVVPVMTWSPSYVDFMYIPWKTKTDVHVNRDSAQLWAPPSSLSVILACDDCGWGLNCVFDVSTQVFSHIGFDYLHVLWLQSLVWYSIDFLSLLHKKGLLRSTKESAVVSQLQWIMDSTSYPIYIYTYNPILG